MNRSNYHQPYVNTPPRIPDYPIEEQLRAQFANRGLGAVSVNAARAAQMQRIQQPMLRSGASQNRPIAQNRSPQNRQAIQTRSMPNRPVSSCAPHPAKPITESRPPVSQKIPLYEVKTRRTSLPMAVLVGLLVCTMMVLSVVWGSGNGGPRIRRAEQPQE